jgi:cyclopropane-fatty-acyl-phospholipid synthase
VTFAARAAVHALASAIRSGRLELRESWSGRSHAFGPADADLRGEIVVHDPAFYSRVVRERSIGLGEAYAEGLWDSPDLVAALRIPARELRRADPLRRRARRVARPLRRLWPDALRNTREGARRNIAAHYDLGNELFELFLDRESMMYSCALFAREQDSLEQAQRAKLERICSALELGPDTHLVEIGTGWGGLAVYAAANYGCPVTTTTISREQRAYAEARVRREGLQDLVRVVGMDYRDLRGQFDRLVSIEMIEAVGTEYFDEFFRRCSALLRPDGLMFLQAICIDDRAYEAEKDSPSFSNRLIFPGGCLPSVETIARCVASVTDMRTVWLEDISPSYALTLRAWRERFVAAAERLGELGYDRRFRRLWELYLAISEAGFRVARNMDVQTLLAKPAWRASVLSSLAGGVGAAEDGSRLPAAPSPKPCLQERGTRAVDQDEVAAR